ncbi:TatD family hydrolase [Opitutaceae bacterium]
MYIDAHNHLQDAWLQPHLDQLAGHLVTLGLSAAVVNGTCEGDWDAVTTLARRFPWVRPSYGVHPWDAGNRTPAWLDHLRSRLLADPQAAVGEIGIDRWMTDSARPDDARLSGLRRAPLSEQSEVFLTQLALATELDRPATVHCLQAWGALDELLRGSPRPARGFLLHAYSGPKEMVPGFAQLGAYFSFNGAFLDPRKEAIREAFLAVPSERLLVETDAPAMLPPPMWRTHKLPPTPEGTGVNHPGNIEAAYAGLAALRGLSVKELAAQVAANFTRLFGE